MFFNIRSVAILASISIVINALPLNSEPRHIVPRQKNYSVINVDGGNEPALATTVLQSTKTVEVVNPGPTVTQEVTTTVIDAAPTPGPVTSSECTTSTTVTLSSKSTSTSTSSITSISSKPIETPKPIFITVTVPKDDGPTEYYDNGMWHTNYRIKTFGAAVPTTVSSASISTVSSSSRAVETPTSS